VLVWTALRRLEASFCAGLTHRWCQPCVVTAAVLLTAASLAAGCGTGALRGPAKDHPKPGVTSSSSAESPTASATDKKPVTTSPGLTQPPSDSAAGRKLTYTYSLPIGDTANAQDDAVVYMYLLRGDCAFAQYYLNRNWYRLGTGGPRTVLMLQAAIEMCRGNDSAARHFVQIAETRYGWSGLARDRYSCNIYRATGSVWQQVPQSSLNCPGGDIPLWPGNRTFPSNRACEDPRTGTGKCPSKTASTEPATPTSTPPSTPTESSPATPTTKATLPSTSASATS
jgi:hypothetical protein